MSFIISRKKKLFKVPYFFLKSISSKKFLILKKNTLFSNLRKEKVKNKIFCKLNLKLPQKKNLSKEQYKTNCVFRYYFIFAFFARNKKTRILSVFFLNLFIIKYFFPKENAFKKMLDLLT
jgi:hypothetical protein